VVNGDVGVAFISLELAKVVINCLLSLFSDAVGTWNCDGPKEENSMGSPIHLNNQQMTTFGSHHHHQHGDEGHHLNSGLKNAFLGSTFPTAVYQGTLKSNCVLPQSQTNTLTTFTSSNSATPALGTNNGKDLINEQRGPIIDRNLCVERLPGYSFILQIAIQGLCGISNYERLAQNQISTGSRFMFCNWQLHFV